MIFPSTTYHADHFQDVMRLPETDMWTFVDGNN